MNGGTNNRFFSRVLLVGLMALAFAGCAAMLSSTNRSLFTEMSNPAYAEATR
jgi:hypothetical protein